MEIYILPTILKFQPFISYSTQPNYMLENVITNFYSKIHQRFDSLKTCRTNAGGSKAMISCAVVRAILVLALIVVQVLITPFGSCCPMLTTPGHMLSWQIYCDNRGRWEEIMAVSGMAWPALAQRLMCIFGGGGDPELGFSIKHQLF